MKWKREKYYPLKRNQRDKLTRPDNPERKTSSPNKNLIKTRLALAAGPAQLVACLM